MKSGFINIKDGKLYYEIEGQGQPLILMHAYSVDMTMWDKQVSELAKDFTVIRYDARGYGKSTLPTGEPFSHSEDLIELMDGLNIDKAHLLGLSMGANTLSDFLTYYEHRVLSCILVAGGVGEKPTKEEKMKLIEYWREEGLEKHKEVWIQEMMNISGPNMDLVKSDLVKMIENWSGFQVINYENMRSNPEVNTSRDMEAKTIKVPVLGIVGMYDSQGSKNATSKIITYCENGTMKYLENGGHFCNMDDKMAFMECVCEFLKYNRRS